MFSFFVGCLVDMDAKNTDRGAVDWTTVFALAAVEVGAGLISASTAVTCSRGNWIT